MLKFLRKTPLAWHQLMKQKTRLAVALAGIAFADILMFVQMGLLDSLYDSATKPLSLLQADLVLLNPQTKTLIDLPGFSRKRLYQTMGYPGVASVSPLYVGFAPWRNPQTRVDRSILVWGVSTDQSPFAFLSNQQQLNQLDLLGQGLFDQTSRPEFFGPIAQMVQQETITKTEVNNKALKAVGLFKMGASFGADGNLIVSDSTFLNLFGDRTASQIDIGLIRLQPNADVSSVQKQLQANLPQDVKVLSKAELVELEKTYWATGGTGFIFNMGTVVGFVVGTVIVYQILYTDVSDHLPEYATLKAMGYSDRYLMGVLVQEVVVLAVLGFIPGFVLSLGLYQLTAAASGYRARPHPHYVQRFGCDRPTKTPRRRPCRHFWLMLTRAQHYDCHTQHPSTYYLRAAAKPLLWHWRATQTGAPQHRSRHSSRRNCDYDWTIGLRQNHPANAYGRAALSPSRQP
jgi:putative ABC transport system permease protein